MFLDCGMGERMAVDRVRLASGDDCQQDGHARRADFLDQQHSVQRPRQRRHAWSQIAQRVGQMGVLLELLPVLDPHLLPAAERRLDRCCCPRKGRRQRHNDEICCRSSDSQDGPGRKHRQLVHLRGRDASLGNLPARDSETHDRRQVVVLLINTVHV